MTREDISKLALSKIDNTKYLILELITGFGKTKICIDLLKKICTKDTKVLILVAKTVHKSTWLNEINKWGGLKANITIECYESFKNYYNKSIDIIVADEMQHLSDTRLDILKSINFTKFIGLSATIKYDMKQYFTFNYNAEVIKCGLKEAVDNNVLPEPLVYTIPLILDNKKCMYKTKRFKKDIITTQKGYYDNISTLINWYKNKYFHCSTDRLKNMWLSTAGKRLKWLSNQKNTLVLDILEKYKDNKVLTFCSSIEQAELLGKYNITSKNNKSIDNLNMFNDNKIKHITACNILNEGVNLTNCQIGIFCNLNSSDIIVKQRIGRLLRHKQPILIIPYFVGTREEELLTKMLMEYSNDKVKSIHSIDEIEL